MNEQEVEKVNCVFGRHDERIKTLETNWTDLKESIILQTKELTHLSKVQSANENKLLEMFKQVNITQARMSKDLWGNGRKGLLECFTLLTERTENDRETHDKDIKRIDSLLWFVGTTSVLSMLVIIGFFCSLFITNIYQNKTKKINLDVVKHELKI